MKISKVQGHHHKHQFHSEGATRVTGTKQFGVADVDLRLAATLMCRHAASIIVKMWLPVWLGTHGHVDSAVAAMLLMYVLEARLLLVCRSQSKWSMAP